MDGVSAHADCVLSRCVLLLHPVHPQGCPSRRAGADLSNRRPLARRTMARTKAGVRTRGCGSHSPLRHSAGFAPAFPASPSRYPVVDWRHHTSALSALMGTGQRLGRARVPAVGSLLVTAAGMCRGALTSRPGCPTEHVAAPMLSHVHSITGRVIADGRYQPARTAARRRSTTQPPGGTRDGAGVRRHCGTRRRNRRPTASHDSSRNRN
jgi:hypothetical protein